MPADNQGQPQDPGPGRAHDNGGLGQGARETLKNVGRQVHDTAEAARERLQEGYETVSEETARRYRRAERIVARNPAPSLLVGFGFGFGLGLVVATLLSRSESSLGWLDRHTPDSLKHMPDSFHHLGESIRDLPDAIARRMPSSMKMR